MNQVVESRVSRLSRLGYARYVLFPCSSGVALPYAQQRSSHHEQISQRTGDEQPVGILGDAAVAHLGEAEEPLDAAGIQTQTQQQIQRSQTTRDHRLIHSKVVASCDNRAGQI